jgi:hypothetical protein
MVVAWQTGFRGKDKRGRSYFPGLTSTNVPDPGVNVLAPAMVSAMASGANAFLAGLTGGAAPSLELAIISRKHGIATNVGNARCDSAIGIQRRRYEKVARH